MELLSNLGTGLSVALSFTNLFFLFIGVIVGTVVGVLPGLGPTAGMAMLIPLTSGLEPVTAIIMLAGIYYGSMYGGSTTAILINSPGEAASVITAVDGYQLAKQGKAGKALGMAAISSFIAGTVGVVGLMLLAPPLSEIALSFGPPEYFALMFLGMTIIMSLSGVSLTKGLMMGAFGMILAMIGLDPITGASRLTLGTVTLLNGIDFISVVVGMFAVSEVISNSERALATVYEKRIGKLLPTIQDWIKCKGALARGSLMGFFVGILPGASAAVAAFLAYDTEKKFSKNPEEFGKGALEGVAAAEGANNSAASGGMIPLLTLGIPCSPPMAILLGAFMIHGLRPGPLLFTDNPDFVWGVIVSMYLGNVALLILNLPLVRLWVKIAEIPYPILGPTILLLSFVGTYSVRNSMFDVWVCLIFGIIGYVLQKMEFPSAPLVLALILTPMMESAFRQALAMSRGDYAIFFSRPIAVVLLAVAAISLIYSIYGRINTNSKAAQMIASNDNE
ncbi:MAG: tripartite tricarboxylate transporter permease [Desulfitobacteriia bacterium]|jgi:putative tricarboxylic transport membrane protein